MTRGPDGADMVCPLCERPLPRHARQSVHHLIPKLKGGAKGPTVRLHEICHRTIHKNLTETQLARTYNTIEALRTALHYPLDDPNPEHLKANRQFFEAQMDRLTRPEARLQDIQQQSYR